MASSSSSSSSHVHQIKYDVFISFRGSDTRHGFLSHLKKELRQKHIDAYVDERLERGDEISLALLKAIEGSMISLVIFSKDYASSKWCLEELVKIMECKEVNEQTVIPVFYNIDPSDVRHQKGTYGNAFAQHEQKSKINIEKLQIWRSVLNKAANLSGYHYSSHFENESELIDEIVKDVLKKLDDKDPIEPKHLVGFDKTFASVESLMEIDLQEVRILGIWGMGGIGKTTLAHALFDKFFPRFESCCFLENVREESKMINGLSYLGQKLFSVLLNQEIFHMNDAMRARSNKRRLHRKKVFIVLDDVDTSKQLKDLAGEQLYLGPGSRVIVTSRDKQVLISGGIHAIHEVKELSFQESLKLFSLNAFNQSHPKRGYEELSERAVVYAKGIPLALEVLGSYFHSRNIETWESALKKLQKYPNMQIQNVLKVSYDSLDDVEKEIFLDIAFFFKGGRKDNIIRVLDACGFYATSGIDNLVNKALIKISHQEVIEMHDLIQEMGEQIVREESIKNPERRSRLKDPEEIYDLLKNNMGTDAVEGIILDMSQIKDIQMSADTFTKMANLRILKFYSNELHENSNINLPFGLESFSNKLRYFHWHRYPLEGLPLGFCPEKLVELRMEESRVKKLWDGVQDLVNLKCISLNGSKQLIELPDFSMAHNLEKVDLSNCTSLCNVHPSILSLHTLVYMRLFGCKRLKSLQSETHLKSLQYLEVGSCHSLEKFSLSSEEMNYLGLSSTTKIEILHLPIGHCRKLECLLLNGSRIMNLPINELCCLTSLKTFHLQAFKQVIDEMELHSLFDALRSLRELHLIKCSKLSKIPDNISSLTLLQVLSLNESSVESLPASIEQMSELVMSNLTKCGRLRSILGLPPFIQLLEASECTSLETVFSLTTMPKSRSCLFSFKNCLKLDEHSLCYIMELTHFSMTAAIFKYCGNVKVCYPGSRVPRWFSYNQTVEASITIEIAPPFDQLLLGFVFCCILPQFASTKDYYICCDYSEDVDKHKFCIEYDEYIPLNDLNSDHVFLWYVPYQLENAQRSYDEGIAPKLACEFYVRYHNGCEYVKLDGLIKACGVCPIYMPPKITIWSVRRN